MLNLSFQPLETEVLKYLLDGESSVLETLRKQLSLCGIKSREYTGVGFYLNFTPPTDHPKLHEVMNVKPRFCFGDVEVIFKIGNRQQEVGFLLWIDGGFLECLEGYAYGDEKWPVIFDEFQVHYFTNNRRNLVELERSWRQ